MTKNPKIQLELTIEQGRAVVDALDAYSRLCIGQLEEVACLVNHGVIPMARPYGQGVRQMAPAEVCRELEAIVAAAKQLLGYPSNGSNGIGHPDVAASGHRAYEIKKVLEKAISEHVEPNPTFRGVNYDGLGPRYTQDPAPVAVVI